MKNYPGYTDLFISPVSGLININNNQELTPNYIWVGNQNYFAQESPSLIDIKLELINLRKKLNNTPFIIQHPVSDFYASQALSEVMNGLIANLNGVIVPANLTYNYIWIGNEDNFPVETLTLPSGGLPDLPYQNIWIGDDTNRPVPNQRIGTINLPPFVTADPTANFGIYNLYTGGTVNLSNPIGDPGPVPSTTLRVDASNLPNLSKGKIWMGVVNFTPPVITIDTTSPYFHVEGSLNWDAVGAFFDSHAVPTEMGLEPNYIFIGDSDNPGLITTTLFQIDTGTGLEGGPIVGNGTISIADTGVTPGTYDYATVTVNAQGQITDALSNTPTDGTVTEINTGTGLIGGPITTSGTISIADTSVVPGTYAYATITVNAQGQLLDAIDNSAEIMTMQDDIATNTTNISTNTTNIASNTTAISTLNTAVFGAGGLVDVVGGLVTNVGVWSSSTSISDTIGTWTSSSSMSDVINTNTSDINYITTVLIPAIPGSVTITLSGAVTGSGPSTSPVVTTLQPIPDNIFTLENSSDSTKKLQVSLSGITHSMTRTWTIQDASGTVALLSNSLDQFAIPQANLNINNYALYNVAPIPDNLYTDSLSGRAVNFDWLLNFLDNQQMLVGFVPEYIFPTIILPGQTQNFQFQNYQSLSQFQIENIFSPILNNFSQNCIEFVNINSSGFRFRQITSTESTYGQLVLENFENGSIPGNPLITFEESGYIQFNENLNMNGSAVYEMENIEQDLYDDYLVGQGINLDWFTSFLNNEVI